MGRGLFRWYVKTWALFMFFLTAARVIFVVWHLGERSPDITDFFLVLLFGLMTDSSVCAIVMAACFLAALPFRWISFRAEMRAHAFLHHLFAIILILVSLVDIFYFGQFGTRLTVLSLNIFHDTSEITATIGASFPLWQSMVVLALLFTGFFILSRRWRRKVAEMERHTLLRFLAFLLAGFALSFLYLGPPFWRISSIFPDSLMNQASLNGIYSFIKSAQTEGLNASEIPEHAYGDVRKALEAVRSIRSPDEKYIPSVFSDFLRKRNDSLPPNGKNVVIIIMESFGANLCGALNNGKGFTPAFDAWSGKGILYTRFYSNGPRTVQGLVSTVASFPAILGGHPIRRKGLNEMHTLGNVMAGNGYETQFIHNGDPGFDDMDIFMKAGGFRKIVGKDDFKQPLHIESRGVSDEDLFNKAYEMIWKGNGKPKLSVLLSLTNHLPYETPPSFEKANKEVSGMKPMERGMAYSDYALGKFLERCSQHPEFSNTLFLILGDHAEMSRPEDSEMGIFHIPLLILNSGLGPGRDSLAASQTDVAPTVLALTHLSCVHHFMGVNLLGRHRPAFAFCKGYGNDVFFTWDNTQWLIKYYFEDREYDVFRLNEGRNPTPAENHAAPPSFVDFTEAYLQSVSHVYRNGHHRFR